MQISLPCVAFQGVGNPSYGFWECGSNLLLGKVAAAQDGHVEWERGDMKGGDGD